MALTVRLPWSGRVDAAVARYEAELRAELPGVRRKALVRQMRDARTDRLLRRYIAAGEPVPDRIIGRLLRFYERALHAHFRAEERRFLRAEARETRLAVQWGRAVRLTGLDPRQVVKVWRTRMDAKVRPEHRIMEGKAVPSNAAFMVDGVPVETPPADHGCRCFIEWIVLDYIPDLRADGTVIFREAT